MCGKEIPDSAKFCLECGKRIEIIPKAKFCMECGSDVVENSKFCMECGKEIVFAEPNQEQTTQQEQTIEQPQEQEELVLLETIANYHLTSFTNIFNMKGGRIRLTNKRIIFYTSNVFSPLLVRGKYDFEIPLYNISHIDVEQKFGVSYRITVHTNNGNCYRFINNSSDKAYELKSVVEKALGIVGEEIPAVIEANDTLEYTLTGDEAFDELQRLNPALRVKKCLHCGENDKVIFTTCSRCGQSKEL